MLFADHASPASRARTARRVLHRLSEAGLVRHLERRVGGLDAGSASHIWTLTEAGSRLVRRHAAALGEASRRRFHEPSTRLLNHCLAINEAVLAIGDAQRQSGNADATVVELEPASWRRYSSYGGAEQLIRPDLAAVTITTVGAETFEDRWFLEIDLGNEHLPTLLAKCRQYIEYRRSGQEQEVHDVFPVVIWVMHRDERRDQLTAAVAAAGDIDSRLFRVTTFDGLRDVITGGAL